MPTHPTVFAALESAHSSLVIRSAQQRAIIVLYRLLFVFMSVCLSVGHAINEMDELWQQIQVSRRGVFRRGRNLSA